MRLFFDHTSLLTLLPCTPYTNQEIKIGTACFLKEIVKHRLRRLLCNKKNGRRKPAWHSIPFWKVLCPGTSELHTGKDKNSQGKAEGKLTTIDNSHQTKEIQAAQSAHKNSIYTSKWLNKEVNIGTIDTCGLSLQGYVLGSHNMQGPWLMVMPNNPAIQEK